VSMPTISVVIPTYRRRQTLERIVDAIAADPAPRQIVVVVDGSDDGSMQLLRAMAGTEPRLEPVWQGKLGQGAARDTGVGHTDSDVVLLLDDDVVAGPGLATGHAKVHATLDRTLGRAVVLGYMPTRCPSPRRPGDFAARLYAEDYERACERYEADPGSVITHLWAGNMSLRRADALAVGLDSGPGLLRHEDQAFGLRCARAGLHGVFERSLAATHEHGQDLAGFERQFYQQGRSRRRLAELFPELVTADDPVGSLPAGPRQVVSALTVTHRAARPALRLATRLAGRTRLWGAETAAARLLRQIELARGFRSA